MLSRFHIALLPRGTALAAVCLTLAACRTGRTVAEPAPVPEPPPVTAAEPEPEPAPPPRPDARPEPRPAPPPPEPPLVREPLPVPANPDVARPPLTGTPVEVRPEAVLPRYRIVAFYGNPASERMGILGALPPERMLERLEREAAAWEAADPSHPVKPALQLIASLAAGTAGRDSLYRMRMPDWRIDQVAGWAKRKDALLILDVQTGRSTVEAEVGRLRDWLIRPEVHLALDPEWNMGPGGFPGRTIGSMTAAEINWAIRFLAGIVEKHDLPPKVLVVHRFTSSMVRDADEILSDPRVQVILHMDGWGPPAMKLDTYRAVVAPAAEQFTGFKLFYVNDVRDGSRMLRPEEILALRPVPLYIQYQ